MYHYLISEMHGDRLGMALSGSAASPSSIFKHSVCEVRSSFYTNNPLLYISHYSEIIVSSGYDVTTSAGMASPTSHLSARRELVEQLDSEPLFDYLIQNGVLDQAIIDEIRNEKSAAKVSSHFICVNSVKCCPFKEKYHRYLHKTNTIVFTIFSAIM